MTSAHRWAYEQWRGLIPIGVIVDHLCCVTSCVNPWHLELVSQSENSRRGNGGFRRTHCPSGHPYDMKNTRVYRGMRYCRACSSRQTVIKNRRKRAALREGA
jgi:hypothetical protein